MHSDMVKKIEEIVVSASSENEMFEKVLLLMGLPEEQLTHGNIIPNCYDDVMVGTMWAIWQCRAMIGNIIYVDQLIVGSVDMKN